MHKRIKTQKYSEHGMRVLSIYTFFLSCSVQYRWPSIYKEKVVMYMSLCKNDFIFFFYLIGHYLKLFGSYCLWILITTL